VQKGELEERIDPLFYVAVENIKKDIQRKAKYDCADLIQVCSINRGRFGHRPRNDPKFYGGKYPFIQTGDIVAASYGNASIKYTQTLNEFGLNTSKLFLPPKLLFTIAANIGDTAILDYQSCFPDSIVALVPKRDDLSIEYLNVYLRIIKKYIVDLAPYAAQRNLNNQQLAKVPVVVPHLAIQSEIVSRMDAAYAAKKQKEAEAQRLLESIDGYLLGELGIELPEQEENTLHSRIFRRRFSEISGGRFDAPVYQKTYLLETKKFPMMKFKECVIINPLVSFSGYHQETLASFLPMEKVSDRYGEAEISDCRTVSESGGYTKFKENDLLWAKITPCMQNGKSAVVNGLKNGIGFGSTEFHVFRAKDEVDIRYIHGLLRLVSLRKYAMLYFSGSAGHQRVSDEFFIKFSIPLPPLSVQTEIANRIAEIRSRAKQLQQEAKDGLEQAKREIETMILGHS